MKQFLFKVKLFITSFPWSEHEPFITDLGSEHQKELQGIYISDCLWFVSILLPMGGMAYPLAYGWYHPGW